MNPLLLPHTREALDTKAVHLMVHGEMTPLQRAEVEHRFFLHKMNVRVSAAPFLTHNGKLSDGTQFRFMSNSGLHTVEVWPVGGGETNLLPHGLAVVTNWRPPFIFRWAPSDDVWSVDGTPLPQIPHSPNEVTGYGQVVRGASRPLVLPMVYNRDSKRVWDFASHAAPANPATWCVPSNVEYPQDGVQVFDPRAIHYLLNNTVVIADGTVIYTATPPDAILGIDSEPLEYLPGNSDAVGLNIVLQMVRRALLSIETDLWKTRFCNEALQRSARNTYTRIERNVVDLTTPLYPSTATTDDTTTENDTGLALFTDLFATRFLVTDQASVPWPPFGPSGEWLEPNNTRLGFWGASREDLTLTPTVSEASYLHTFASEAGDPVVIGKLVALPGEVSVEYAQLSHIVSYPKTLFFRGGTKTWNGGFSPAAGERGYSRDFARSKRIDAEADVAGTGISKLMLGWVEIKVLESDITGHLEGALHVDTFTDTTSGGDLVFYTYAAPDATNPGGSAPTPQANHDAWEGASNLMPGWLAEWSAAPAGVPAASPGSNVSLTTSTTLLDTPLLNTASYNYTSRFVIDYDHRARFFAAIRVEVVCTDAQWGPSTAYPGAMQVVTNPSYTVRVTLEANWNGATSETLLASASGSRPAFEFDRNFARNVYIYPADDTGQDFIYHFPPQVGLPEEIGDCLMNLTKHQGVNTALAAQDAHLITDPDEAMASSRGIESTKTLTDTARGVTTVELQKRYVRGQLYARTFKLSDAAINKALWLLYALSMDAPESNVHSDTSVDWFYMPSLGATIADTVFHIEIRNGRMSELWSDEVPAVGDTVRPAAAARDIKLYQI